MCAEGLLCQMHELFRLDSKGGLVLALLKHFPRAAYRVAPQCPVLNTQQVAHAARHPQQRVLLSESLAAGYRCSIRSGFFVRAAAVLALHYLDQRRSKARSVFSINC